MKNNMNEKRYLGYKAHNDLVKMEETLDELVEESKKVWLIDAVAYLRYSTHMQDNGVSIEYQINEIEEYAKRNGYRIVEWYIDKAATAKQAAGRDNFIRLFKDIERGATPKALIIWGTNRFFRNAYESHTHREKLKKANIKLLSVTQTLDEDSTSGRLMIDMIARIDQYKLEEIAEHNSSATRLLIKEGFFAGGVPPFGYKIEKVMHNGKQRSKLAINEEEAVYVREIFDRIASGVSIRSVCRSLSEKGIRGRNGKEFAPDTLLVILKNIIYKGERYYKMKIGDDVYVKNYCSPIVENEVFAAVQRILENNKEVAKGRTRQRIYPLTGKLRCETCGRAFTGTNTGKHTYYACRSKSRMKRCGVKMVRRDWIEATAFELVIKNLLTDKAIDKITKQVMKDIKKTPAIEGNKNELYSRKATLEREIAETVQMKLNGEINGDIMIMMNAEKEKELQTVNVKIAELKAAVNPNITPSYIKSRIESIFDASVPYEECSPEMLQELFSQTIEKVVISNTQVEFHLRLPMSKSLDNSYTGSPLFELTKFVAIK